MNFKTNTSQQLKLLIIIFLLGFTSLVGVNQLFLTLEEDLDKETTNLKSKIALGKLIASDLHILKSSFFELTAATNSKRSRDIVNKRISITMNDIFLTLKVLEKGGILNRVIKLNIAGHTTAQIQLEYIKKNQDEISLEVIDIQPKLAELVIMISELNTLLESKTTYIRSKDTSKMLYLSKKISRFNKASPAYFDRMIENIQRLLYEGNISLKELNTKISKEKEKLDKVLISTNADDFGSFPYTTAFANFGIEFIRSPPFNSTSIRLLSFMKEAISFRAF